MASLQTTHAESDQDQIADYLTCMVCAAKFPSLRTYEEIDDLIPVCTDRCRRLLSARLTSLRNITEG
jgi:hypothetical protein